MDEENVLVAAALLDKVRQDGICLKRSGDRHLLELLGEANRIKFRKLINQRR